MRTCRVFAEMITLIIARFAWSFQCFRSKFVPMKLILYMISSIKVRPQPVILKFSLIMLLSSACSMKSPTVLNNMLLWVDCIVRVYSILGIHVSIKYWQGKIFCE